MLSPSDRPDIDGAIPLRLRVRSSPIAALSTPASRSRRDWGDSPPSARAIFPNAALSTPASRSRRDWGDSPPSAPAIFPMPSESGRDAAKSRRTVSDGTVASPSQVAKSKVAGQSIPGPVIGSRSAFGAMPQRCAQRAA